MSENIPSENSQLSTGDSVISDQRKITREDIFIKARMLSEGVRLSEHDSARLASPGTLFDFRPLVLDGCETSVSIQLNPYSRLEVMVDGDRVTVSDLGNVLATGRLEEQHAWHNELLSNGQTAKTVLPGMSARVINIHYQYFCYNWNRGQGCRYCNLFSTIRKPAARQMESLSFDGLAQMAKLQAEAVKIAIDHGWRGAFVIGGGALPPSRHHQFLDMLENVLTPLHNMLGSELFSALPVVLNSYPPEDFSEMYAWKDLGINGTSIDIEVLDQAYFAAICPGKHAYKPHEYWKESHIASTEVFNRASTGIVVGIEPMNSLIEGVEERLSKGVMPLPFSFMPATGSHYEKFRPPTADWIVEASGKMAESFIRHADKFVDARHVDEGSSRPNEPPFSPINVVADEVRWRIQEMALSDNTA